MITLTKEWLLKTIAELEEERDATPGVVNEDAAMALAAMIRALASLEADRKLSDFVASQESLGVEFEGVLTENIEELYVPSKSTPPASVSDSLLSELLAIAKKAADAADECAHAEWSDDSMEHSTAIADWERRAAMLQGAEPVSNRDELPDGWVACSERMPEGMTDVHISNGHDVGQGWWEGDAWQTQHDYYSVPGDVTHWMPLPAAPQQEVK
ncbi:DUF551 domain-containing protein [Enterobacter hormaechei]|uniref:DUF551 domain-containing protein n=1 Tax=Enterobacter cloacae complex TaxID=354276 RepID=UPI000DCE4094|nr:DUF551 domain-containing protein [Enterobacter hormaechei]RAZ53519.1 hypothetical protein DP194_22220 [Enterobacter hormaechei subsp. xiangfangensis]WMA77634.1 DUF551 domain-containing protein [Enterobacter hormaechei]WMA82340.1 DUF551 domain-containing protein [Enterobacter hormaechei]HCT6444715.1 DUF551 domain-containing protein [Enterobacter hormaechei]